MAAAQYRSTIRSRSRSNVCWTATQRHLKTARCHVQYTPVSGKAHCVLQLFPYCWYSGCVWDAVQQGRRFCPPAHDPVNRQWCVKSDHLSTVCYSIWTKTDDTYTDPWESTSAVEHFRALTLLIEVDLQRFRDNSSYDRPTTARRDRVGIGRMWAVSLGLWSLKLRHDAILEIKLSSLPFFRDMRASRLVRVQLINITCKFLKKHAATFSVMDT